LRVLTGEDALFFTAFHRLMAASRRGAIDPPASRRCGRNCSPAGDAALARWATLVDLVRLFLEPNPALIKHWLWRLGSSPESCASR
jgi:hypothetical protein